MTGPRNMITYYLWYLAISLVGVAGVGAIPRKLSDGQEVTRLPVPVYPVPVPYEPLPSIMPMPLEREQLDCCVSCGYSYCKTLDICVRPWETYCSDFDVVVPEGPFLKTTGH